MFLKFCMTFSVYWHLLAFAFGGVAIWISLRQLFGGEDYDPRWKRVIRLADAHLIWSGLAIIVVGCAMTGYHTYFANPKVWTKVTVVACWLAAAYLMRRFAVPALCRGDRRPMLWLASISLSTWIYGAFLGVAKPLANGVLPFSGLLAGFAITLLGCSAYCLRREAVFRLSGVSTKAEGTAPA